MKKRWICGLLAAVMALSAAGCSAELPDSGAHQLGAYSRNEEETEIIPARDSISMVFYEDMDTNPLTATNSENHELLKLVYSAPVRLDLGLYPQRVLAESIAAEGDEVTLTLKEGLKFSNGEAVTAADYADSLRTVQRNPSSPYYNRLENVRYFTAEGARKIRFKLKEADVDFESCLDIPIVQRETGLGCGAYCFSKKSGETVLVPNKHYFTAPYIDLIRLKKPRSEKERQNMFSVGLLDVYFENAESETAFSGGKNYEVQSYPSDNLLFLGINCKDERLSSAGLRGFLNGLPDREKLAESVLLGLAEATCYPFRANWYRAAEFYREIAWDAPEKRTRAEKIGYQLTEKALLDAKGKSVGFSLLLIKESEVHQEVAAALVDSYALSGVKLKLEAVERAEYDRRLAAGEYQLYLGELRTGRSLNTALFAQGSAIHFSGAAFEKLEAAAADYRSGSGSLKAFAKEFDRATPIIPLCYRRGALYVSSDIGSFRDTGPWALYGDISKLITKETEIKK